MSVLTTTNTNRSALSIMDLLGNLKLHIVGLLNMGRDLESVTDVDWLAVLDQYDNDTPPHGVLAYEIQDTIGKIDLLLTRNLSAAAVDHLLTQRRVLRVEGFRVYREDWVERLQASCSLVGMDEELHLEKSRTWSLLQTEEDAEMQFALSDYISFLREMDLELLVG